MQPFWRFILVLSIVASGLLLAPVAQAQLDPRSMFNDNGQSSGSGPGSEQGGYLFFPIKINPVSQPWTFRQEARKCMNNKACGAVVDSVGAYFGVPPGTIKKTMQMADNMGFGESIRHRGEEYWQDFTPPHGYIICHLHIRTISAAPDRGKYSPTLSIEVTQKHLKIYNFVHKLKMGKGRSWYDGVATAVLQEERVARLNEDLGVPCSVRQSRPIKYSCKGARGTNGGKQACNYQGYIGF